MTQNVNVLLKGAKSSAVHVTSGIEISVGYSVRLINIAARFNTYLFQLWVN